MEDVENSAEWACMITLRHPVPKMRATYQSSKQTWQTLITDRGGFSAWRVYNQADNVPNWYERATRCMNVSTITYLTGSSRNIPSRSGKDEANTGWICFCVAR